VIVFIKVFLVGSIRRVMKGVSCISIVY
jgi:hypothetical protein